MINLLNLIIYIEGSCIFNLLTFWNFSDSFDHGSSKSFIPATRRH